MQHYQSLDPVKLKRSWLTIGSFDGVHLGHQQILKQLVNGARAAQEPSVVVTFFPHPAVVLGKGTNGGYLSTPEERAELLGACGVDVVITLPFTRELAALSALDFMKMVQDHLGISHLLVGYDFALGRGREGNVERLREIGDELGYQLEMLEPVEFDGSPVSSSQVRRLIRSGDVEAAARLLGRRYTVEGLVVHGDGRGKALGFPTANLETWQEQVMPVYGVYTTWAWVDGVRHPSVSSFGLRPTFKSDSSVARLEAYLMNYSGDLYGKNIRLEFVAYLRPELRFETVDALIEQMNRDTIQSLEVLGNER
ncbi:MAG: bifunctional riboflavin kinase/FAD synthetase [Bellilinea sp.]